MRDRHRARRPRRDDPIGFRRFQALDRRLRHLLRERPIAGVEGGQAAAVLARRHDDLRATCLEDAHRRVRHFREEAVGEALDEIGDARARRARSRSAARAGSARPRLRRSARQRAGPAQAPSPGRADCASLWNRSRRARSRTKTPSGPASGCARRAANRAAGRRARGSTRVPARGRLYHGRPIPLDGAMAHIEDLLRQGDIHRADGRAGIAGDAERLRPGGILPAIMEAGIHQPDCARIDVAEGMTADDLIGRADIRARAAADAAERLAEDPDRRASSLRPLSTKT